MLQTYIVLYDSGLAVTGLGSAVLLCLVVVALSCVWVHDTAGDKLGDTANWWERWHGDLCWHGDHCCWLSDDVVLCVHTQTPSKPFYSFCIVSTFSLQFHVHFLFDQQDCVQGSISVFRPQGPHDPLHRGGSTTDLCYIHTHKGHTTRCTVGPLWVNYSSDWYYLASGVVYGSILILCCT